MKLTAATVLTGMILTLHYACHSNKKITGSAPAEDSVLFASIERTPCFGICPVYKITIFRSGYTVLHGIRNVKNTGWYHTRLNQRQLQSIVSYVNENKVYEMNDSYVEPRVADFPSTITEINIDGRYKRILNTDPSAPDPLLKWEKFLDSFFDDQTLWTRIENRDNE